MCNMQMRTKKTVKNLCFLIANLHWAVFVKLFLPKEQLFDEIKNPNLKVTGPCIKKLFSKLFLSKSTMQIISAESNQKLYISKTNVLK